MHRALEASPFVGGGRVNARLYDLGGYPGMVLSGSAGEEVTGEVYELQSSNTTDILRILDEYEGVASSGDPPEYTRQIVDVRLITGHTLKAWAYVLADAGRAQVRIASGSRGDSLRRRSRLRRARTCHRSCRGPDGVCSRSCGRRSCARTHVTRQSRVAACAREEWFPIRGRCCRPRRRARDEVGAPTVAPASGTSRGGVDESLPLHDRQRSR
jgi:gamma-glutamylcyclotransferase (GGCT)/AIG2-like uncharacterized protein YtfP